MSSRTTSTGESHQATVKAPGLTPPTVAERVICVVQTIPKTSGMLLALFQPVLKCLMWILLCIFTVFTIIFLLLLLVGGDEETPKTDLQHNLRPNYPLMLFGFVLCAIFFLH